MHEPTQTQPWAMHPPVLHHSLASPLPDRFPTPTDTRGHPLTYAHAHALSHAQACARTHNAGLDTSHAYILDDSVTGPLLTVALPLLHGHQELVDETEAEKHRMREAVAELKKAKKDTEIEMVEVEDAIQVSSRNFWGYFCA